MTWMLCKAALGVAILGGLGCAANQGQAGDSIEWRTGSHTGNPFEIRLIATGQTQLPVKDGKDGWAVAVRRTRRRDQNVVGFACRQQYLVLLFRIAGSDVTVFCHDGNR